MEKLIFAKAGSLFGKEKICFLSLIIFFCLFLSACASSDVSRDAASGVDHGVQNARNVFGGAEGGSVADSYQNASQLTKGALMGGAAGAVTGAFYSGVGIIPGTAAGAILGASYGSYIDSQMTLQDQLENRGATVVILGDQILIVIPSSRVFVENSPAIKPTAYSTLALVTQFINQYVKILVKVSVYTDDTGSQRVDEALSQEQANSVSKFLSASGVDARILYAIGCGSRRFVERRSGAWESQNYRIEITLEKLYV